MNKSEQYNVILLGMVQAPAPAPLMGDLALWVPGSGLPDDLAVTDRIIGAMVRRGYSVISCTTHLHAIDLTVVPSSRPIATDSETFPSEEIQDVARLLAEEYPEFRATMIQIAAPQQYGIGQASNFDPRTKPLPRQAFEALKKSNLAKKTAPNAAVRKRARAVPASWSKDAATAPHAAAAKAQPTGVKLPKDSGKKPAPKAAKRR